MLITLKSKIKMVLVHVNLAIMMIIRIKLVNFVLILFQIVKSAIWQLQIRQLSHARNVH